MHKKSTPTLVEGLRRPRVLMHTIGVLLLWLFIFTFVSTMPAPLHIQKPMSREI